MKLISESLVIEKKSKFYGYLYEIDDVKEIKAIIVSLRQDHKKAVHFPYAYILNNTAGKTDDKEPSNTAGVQILNALERSSFHNHVLIIVRYFGGTKLGAPLLLRSYAKCANECIKR